MNLITYLRSETAMHYSLCWRIVLMFANGVAMIKRSDPIGLIIAVVMYCMAT